MDRKPLFDAVRSILGRPFRQSEVAALDKALDEAFSDLSAVAHTGQLKVSQDGIDHIKRFEGCERLIPGGKVAAYPDPATGAEPWTIGWGATGPDIGPNTVWTQEQADARLVDDIERHAADVRAAIGTAPTTQGQFDALVGFHYNTGAIGRATLTKKHVARDYAGAAAEFGKWVNAGGRRMKGLVRRRQAERALYLK